jgi:hypothetical protein
MSPCRLEDSNLKEINAFRLSVGLTPIKRKVIRCLRCDAKFESRDYPRVRLCRRCRIQIGKESKDYSIDI